MSKVIVRMLMSLILVAWPLAGSWAAGGPSEEPMTATVVEFSVRGDLDEQAGAIIADLMMSAIANTRRFNLKDRLPLSAAAKIAKTQELGSTGLLDPKTAAELGQTYKVDAVVTGGVYKLGDLITVTARLIDTKTASLLRSGQIQGKDIDSIQIKINELAAMITAPPEPPRTYALTIQTEPAGARVRLLNHSTPYQPGIQLPPGDYEVEATLPGYSARKETVRIGDRDVAVTVVLEKARYGLTVRPEPADAQIRLLGGSLAYQPGVALPPGDYEIEVARDGYTPRKFPVRIVDSEVTVPVTLTPAPAPPPPVAPPAPAQYRLTVQPEPPSAIVQLLNSKTPYQPGVQLPPGDYTVEIAQSAYETQQVKVKIVSSDVTVPVTLARKLVAAAPPPSPPPTQYRLTVHPDPPTAQVRLRGSKTVYQPGVALAPGSYTVEVSQSGYQSKQAPVRITNSDLTIPVVLAKLPEISQYRLLVQTDPPGATVRLRGTKATYRAGGVLLPPGNYTVTVSQSGYDSKEATARITDSDLTLPVTLNQRIEPTQYRLTVSPDPPSAKVRLVNAPATYRPGVILPPGAYTVEVSASGYESRRVTARIADADLTLPVELEKVAAPLPVRTPPSTTASLPPPEPATRTRASEWQIRTVQVDDSVSGIDRSEIMKVLNGYTGRTITRQNLLDAAMRVYRSTGITLSFTVRGNTAGTADLSARVSRQVRRSYEGGIPMMTRSQLESTGFGVSVE
ncbi:MAG: PEGA domain-containing protein [Candidatus Contendobacter sp.]|jgi:hypothetical protein|nr:PEGA domain-containing protein [Gammaproteobacteria bacterium]MCC8995156.1 PEGA domain-containing protein [Candidatus Contendobacter sp.]